MDSGACCELPCSIGISAPEVHGRSPACRRGWGPNYYMARSLHETSEVNTRDNVRVYVKRHEIYSKRQKQIRGKMCV